MQIHAYIYKVCSKTSNAGIFYLHPSPTDCVIQFHLHLETMYINIKIYIYIYTFIYLCVCVQIHAYIYKLCSKTNNADIFYLHLATTDSILHIYTFTLKSCTYIFLYTYVNSIPKPAMPAYSICTCPPT